tara:strand:+ start:1105 stop:1953 length:849 start_codon:yes stop_codon:yes gene_type:complete
MNYITGEKFQDLCNTQISVPEFFPYESHLSRAHSAYTFDKYDNWGLIYVNNDLIKSTIKQDHIESGPVDLYSMLEKMKNPFSLVLHCNDSPVEEEDLRYFNIPNCKKIYAQNVLVKDDRVVPLPIGLGNSCWPYGDLGTFESIEIPCTKTKEVFFNFTVEGGCRDVKRPDCFKRCKELGLVWSEPTNQLEYLNKLKDHKFIISPEGNGVDCHRTWEALYLKTIPIVDRSLVTEYFSQYFPMVLVNDWNTFSLDELEGVYENADWSNSHLLDFNNFINKFIDD